MTLTVEPILGLAEFSEGDDLAAALLAAASLRDGDVVVVAQKVISKIEGAVVASPSGVAPDEGRRQVARGEAAAIVADSPWALIVRTRHGFVCANAGVDASNVPDGKLTLLPVDPDASARRLRAALRERGGVDVAVIVADTFGRAWRMGQTDVAIGVAGLEPIRDERGTADRQGAILQVTEAAVADELAGAADLVRSKGEGVPAVILRGFAYEPTDTATVQALVRDPQHDLFTRGAGMLAGALADQAWPDAWVRGLDDADIAAAATVTDGIAVIDAGVPSQLDVADPVDAGLVVAVLVDRGLTVRWKRRGDAVRVEGGLSAAAR